MTTATQANAPAGTRAFRTTTPGYFSTMVPKADQAVMLGDPLHLLGDGSLDVVIQIGVGDAHERAPRLQLGEVLEYGIGRAGPPAQTRDDVAHARFLACRDQFFRGGGDGFKADECHDAIHFSYKIEYRYYNELQNSTS